MKITKNNSITNNYYDRIEKNRQRQKNMYESYDFKLKKLKFSLSKVQSGKENIKILKNNSYQKVKNENQDSMNETLKTMTVKNNNNVKIYSNIIFEKVTSLNNKLTKEEIIYFEKNKETIINNLLKGIEQLNNNQFIINSNQVLNNQNFIKEKQSVTTKESETENNIDKNNISKSTYKTNSKKNSKEKSFKQNLNDKRKKIIKIVFPKNDYCQNNSLKKDSPIRLKYYKEMKFEQNYNVEKSKINTFRNYNNKNIKNLMQDSDLFDISSIKSNVNCNNSTSKYSVSVQNSLMDFIK